MAPHRPLRHFLSVFAVLLSLGLLLDRNAEADPGDGLTVSVLTFGPGDHPFFKFGHTAILIEDAQRGTALVYNYGTFTFNSVWLVPRFLRGKFRYWLSVQRFSTTLVSYAREERSVVAQRLRLTGAQKRLLVERLEDESRDENKYYDYDYYRDNCVTRVRDRIDRATGGALSRISHVPGSMTFRQHTSRMTADAPLLHFALNASLSGPTDRPIEAWEEMFLPAKLQEWLRKAVVESPNGPVPLVEEERVVLEGRPRAVREVAPRTSGPCLSLGCALALVFLLCGHAVSQGSRIARVALGALSAALGIVTGVMGSFFLFLWLCTRHEFAYHNENLLQFPPLALLLVVPALWLAAGGPRARYAWTVSATCLAASVIGLAMKLCPWFAQDNDAAVALMLPVWLGATFALYVPLAGRERPAAGDGRPSRAASAEP